MVQCDVKQWYAVFTRSRFEKTVHNHLSAQGVESFLPQYRSRRQWSDRAVVLDLPLFPSYLFAHVSAASPELFQVLDTRGVVRVVSNGSGPVPVPDAEIDAIRRVLQADVPVQALPWLQPGRQVRVVAGPLMGLQGTVERHGRAGRLLIAVCAIGQMISVDIDVRDLGEL